MNDQVHDVIEDSEGELWFATSNDYFPGRNNHLHKTKFISPRSKTYIQIVLCSVKFKQHLKIKNKPVNCTNTLDCKFIASVKE
nr:two-component regulator propeller domain-containing protein [Bacteroides faecichinchillae]